MGSISILLHFHKIFKPRLFGVLATIDIGVSYRKLFIKTTMSNEDKGPNGLMLIQTIVYVITKYFVKMWVCKWD